MSTVSTERGPLPGVAPDPPCLGPAGEGPKTAKVPRRRRSERRGGFRRSGVRGRTLLPAVRGAGPARDLNRNSFGAHLGAIAAFGLVWARFLLSDATKSAGRAQKRRLGREPRGTQPPSAVTATKSANTSGCLPAARCSYLFNSLNQRFSLSQASGTPTARPCRSHQGIAARDCARHPLAEREGFEPSDEISLVNSLAVSPIRPLSHLSLAASLALKPVLTRYGAAAMSDRRACSG